MTRALRQVMASLCLSTMVGGCADPQTASPVGAPSTTVPATPTTPEPQAEIKLQATTSTPEVATPAKPADNAPTTPSAPPAPDATRALNEGKMGKAKGDAAGQYGIGYTGGGPGGGGNALGVLGHGSGTGVGYGVGGGRGGMRSRASGAPAMQRYDMDGGQTSESYAHHGVNRMTKTSEDKLSTFAVDVDTASYTIARRKLLEGAPVPKDAVRVEEFVNYFKYSYAPPTVGDRAFEVHVDGAPSPFVAPAGDKRGRELVRIGVQGKQIAKAARKKAHLVFLVDVSGSMSSPDKLPLAQRSLRVLVDNLNDGDTVALVTYAGSTRVVLPPTAVDDRATIMAAIDDLSAGGSTAMASGMELAYGLAAKTVSDDSISRVIVLSDGDANVGRTSHQDILNSIVEYRKKGITMSTVGFGMGNYKDSMMEQLANKGDGESYYIDSLSAAKRVFQEQLGGTLEVIAQDVKLQVEWNPAAVESYRLVGYENRDIADADFRDDKVDAGEIGAGHTVTAIYEIIRTPAAPAGAQAASLATVRVRAKKPRGKEAAEWSFPVAAGVLAPSFDAASTDFRFAVAVAAFAEILRGSEFATSWTLAQVAKIASAAAGDSEERREFVSLVGKAQRPS